MNLTKAPMYLFCALLSLTLGSLSAWAQTNVAASSVGTGNWSATSTWNCGAPISGACEPNNGTPAGDFYDVTIDSGTPSNTGTFSGITIDNSPAIDTLTVDSGTSLDTSTAQTLTIGSSNNVGSLTNAGNIYLGAAGSTISVGLSSDPNATVTNSSGAFIVTGCSGCGGSNLFQVHGNLSNSGAVFPGYFGGSGNLFNVTGTFTNASGGNLAVFAGATANIGTLVNSGSVGINPTDPFTAGSGVSASGGTLNVGTLTNSGTINIFSGGSLNLTDQPNGITDIPNGAGISLNEDTRFAAGTNSGFYKLTSIEGTLEVGNGLSGAADTVTPLTGTSTVTSTGVVKIKGAGTAVTIDGNGANSGQVTVTNGASLSLTGTYAQVAGTTTVAPHSVLSVGSYTQSGGVTDVDGTLISPTLSISGGTLQGSGTIEGTSTGGAVSVTFSNATFQPSDPMSIPGSLTLDSTDTWNELWSGPSNYGAADVVGTPGTAALGGAILDITTTNFGSLSNGDMFTILNAVNGVSGAFGAINGLNFGSGDSWTIGYTADAVTLTANIPASTTPEPAGLLLLGTGLLALGWVARRHLGARSTT